MQAAIAKAVRSMRTTDVRCGARHVLPSRGGA